MNRRGAGYEEDNRRGGGRYNGESQYSHKRSYEEDNFHRRSFGGGANGGMFFTLSFTSFFTCLLII